MEEGGEFRNGLNLDTIVACKVDAPDGPAVYIYIVGEHCKLLKSQPTMTQQPFMPTI